MRCTPRAKRPSSSRGAGERSRRFGTLYTSLLPAADSRLTALVRLHAGDPPAEHAGIERLVRQWVAVRDLLSPATVAARPALRSPPG